MVASTMLQAILRPDPDDKWHARFNPGSGQPAARPSGWGAVIGVALALLLGATVLMATIAFSGQRYFEYQVEAARQSAMSTRWRAAWPPCRIIQLLRPTALSRCHDHSHPHPTPTRP
jgi:hypothetical protein